MEYNYNNNNNNNNSNNNNNNNSNNNDNSNNNNNNNGICSGISTRWLLIHYFQIELEFRSVEFCILIICNNQLRYSSISLYRPIYSFVMSPIATSMQLATKHINIIKVLFSTSYDCVRFIFLVVLKGQSN